MKTALVNNFWRDVKGDR